jgi:SAM-dependent methyltransferase/energy-coupling factor transporter ATP-binding protein EcfA2
MKISSIHIPEHRAKKYWNLGGISMSRLGSIVVLCGKNGAGKSRIRGAVKSCLPEMSVNLDGKIELSGEGDKLMHPAIPVNLEIAIPNNMAPRVLQASAEKMKDIGIEGASGSLANIQFVQNKFNLTSHPIHEKSYTDEEKKEAEANLKNYQDLFQKYLGTNITFNSAGNIKLFNQDTESMAASPGQKKLIEMVSFWLHRERSSNTGNYILDLDEIENHLHPEMAIQLLDDLLSWNKNGQIWIATHSIPLLAHCYSIDPNSIWFVEAGQVAHAGSIPEKVLMSLLGDEKRKSELSSFIDLPAELAINTFAAQCLTSPQVVITDNEDRQIQQVCKALQENYKDQSIRILDWGAGKGRFVEALSSLNKEKSEINVSDYCAYDPSHEFDTICRERIAEVFGSDKKRYYNDVEKLLNEGNEDSFDVILMCNVLHEIPATLWLELFSENGYIFKLLKYLGAHLLIIEDTEIRIGELPHKNGFVILNSSQIRKLFNDESIETYSASDDNRLVAHLIPRSSIANVTQETIITALELVKIKAEEQVRILRSAKEKDFRSGRRHGLYAQQYLNASLALNEMKGA